MVHEGHVLLIKRGKEPLLGRWVVPGGTVELGESLEDALVREMEEETAIRVRPLAILTVFDRIDKDRERVRYHYVIVDYLCEYLGGDARAASDAVDVAWVAHEDLGAFDVPSKALEVVEEAFRRSRRAQRADTLPANRSGRILLK